MGSVVAELRSPRLQESQRWSSVLVARGQELALDWGGRWQVAVAFLICSKKQEH